MNHSFYLSYFDGLYHPSMVNAGTVDHLFAPPVHRTGAPRYASFSPGRFCRRSAKTRRPIKRWGGGYASPSEKERCVGFLDLCGLGCRPNFIKIVDVFWDKSRLN